MHSYEKHLITELKNCLIWRFFRFMLRFTCHCWLKIDLKIWKYTSQSFKLIHSLLSSHVVNVLWRLNYLNLEYSCAAFSHFSTFVTEKNDAPHFIVSRSVHICALAVDQDQLHAVTRTQAYADLHGQTPPCTRPHTHVPLSFLLAQLLWAEQCETDTAIISAAASPRSPIRMKGARPLC